MWVCCDRGLSSKEEVPTIFPALSSLRSRAWNAAAIGSLAFDALNSRFENEKRSLSVDGGPLRVADLSDLALTYAFLFRGMFLDLLA